ncbi:MAG: hypothetical protein EOO77_08250 [Oxalobacteraceae bacterium]|nr:MAG: hypothetical protein EOO77_08250 [Oxalobacteraceae bacterium]
MRDLSARGLSGVQLITSDSHQGPNRRLRPYTPVPAGNVAERILCATC